MPQLIFFAVVGVVAYFGYRAFVKEAAARDRQGAARREAGQRPAPSARWSRIPKTGEYRLAKD